MAHEIAEAAFKRAFARIDADGSGKVTKEELAHSLRQFGHNLSDDQVSAIIREVDTDDSGTLDFAEFCQLAQRHKYILASEESLKQIFARFDKDGNGSLSKDEFRDALAELTGKQLAEDQIDAIVKHLDKDGDGTITFDEFQQHWSSN